jgi:hypothetical protein
MRKYPIMTTLFSGPPIRSWLSIARVAAVVAVIIALPSVLPAEEDEGGCSANASHACARASGVVTGYACSQGSSGGCEDCVTASVTDMCFYQNGPAAVGYKTGTTIPGGG